MDLIDKKILCELDLNCRVPYSRLAKKLRIGRNVADYRIKNLEKQGIIQKYICSVNLGNLGYKTYKIYLKVHNMNKKEESFTKDLKDSNKVIHLLKTEGAFDYSITVAVRDIGELDEFLGELKTKYKEIIKDYHVSIVVYSKIFKLNKILLNERQESVKFEKYSSEEKKIELDDKDRLIIREISQNANMPLLEISRKTKLSLDVVKYRMKNINNLVNSFRIILDFNKIGYYHYVLMVRMSSASKEEERKLVEWCASRKEVMYCTKRIGYYDFEINTAITQINELNCFLSDLKENFGEIIGNYELMINTKLIKLNYVPF